MHNIIRPLWSSLQRHGVLDDTGRLSNKPVGWLKSEDVFLYHDAGKGFQWKEQLDFWQGPNTAITRGYDLSSVAAKAWNWKVARAGWKLVSSGYPQPRAPHEVEVPGGDEKEFMVAAGHDFAFAYEVLVESL